VWVVTTPSGFRGFDLVKHGYERGEVDAYLGALAAAPFAGDRPQPPRFRIVRRGYDPGQVDARIAELLGRGEESAAPAGGGARLPTPEILGLIASGLGDWRKLGQPLAARYRARDAEAAAVFATAAVRAAAAAGREVPEIRLARGFVDISLYTTAPDGGREVTAADVALARTLGALAREQGLTALPGEVAQVELALDSADFATAGPFWSALLTGSPDHTVRDSVFHPTDLLPNVWFQQTDPHPLPRQRWHLDLWLAPEVAPARIEAALAAGGTLVDDSQAPAFTVLADPEGNKACVCTALDRA
jgi:4a-hydroxytetrahydrobiopterin dehydratase